MKVLFAKNDFHRILIDLSNLIKKKITLLVKKFMQHLITLSTRISVHRFSHFGVTKRCTVMFWWGIYIYTTLKISDCFKGTCFVKVLKILLAVIASRMNFMFSK